MTSLEYIIEGVLIGLVCSIPLGPMGVLIIQKTLNKGAWPGFFSGLGAAFADLFYASIVAFGLNFVIEDIVSDHHLLVQIIGGLLLVVLGVSIFYKKPKTSTSVSQKEIIAEQRISKSGLFGDFLSLFFLTVSNPVAIVVFMGAFSATNIFVDSVSGEAVTIIVRVWVLLGVLIGASTWWYILSSLVNIFRKKFTRHTLVTINRVAGIILMLLGVVAVLSAFDAVKQLFDAANIGSVIKL